MVVYHASRVQDSSIFSKLDQCYVNLEHRFPKRTDSINLPRFCLDSFSGYFQWPGGGIKMFETFLTHLTGLLQPIAQYLAPYFRISMNRFYLLHWPEISRNSRFRRFGLSMDQYCMSIIATRCHKAGKLVILLVWIAISSCILAVGRNPVGFDQATINIYTEEWRVVKKTEVLIWGNWAETWTIHTL